MEGEGRQRSIVRGGALAQTQRKGRPGFPDTIPIAASLPSDMYGALDSPSFRAHRQRLNPLSSTWRSSTSTPSSGSVILTQLADLFEHDPFIYRNRLNNVQPSLGPFT